MEVYNPQNCIEILQKKPLFSGEKTIKSLQGINTDAFELYNICVNKWPYRLESRYFAVKGGVKKGGNVVLVRSSSWNEGENALFVYVTARRAYYLYPP